MIAAVFGLTAHHGDADQIYKIAIFFGLGGLLIDIAFKPFMVEFFPSDIIGQLSGAMNIFFALGRSAASVIGGFLISMAGENYGVMWYMTLGSGVLCILATLSVPDYRYWRRRRGEPEHISRGEEEFIEAVDQLQ